MLEYSKEILVKVSFDRFLFRKELKKAVKWLKSEDRQVLMMWCMTTFGVLYNDIIQEAFKNLS